MGKGSLAGWFAQRTELTETGYGWLPRCPVVAVGLPHAWSPPMDHRSPLLPTTLNAGLTTAERTRHLHAGAQVVTHLLGSMFFTHGRTDGHGRLPPHLLRALIANHKVRQFIPELLPEERRHPLCEWSFSSDVVETQVFLLPASICRAPTVPSRHCVGGLTSVGFMASPAAWPEECSIAGHQQLCLCALRRCPPGCRTMARSPARPGGQAPAQVRRSGAAQSGQLRAPPAPSAMASASACTCSRAARRQRWPARSWGLRHAIWAAGPALSQQGQAHCGCSWQSG